VEENDLLTRFAEAAALRRAVMAARLGYGSAQTALNSAGAGEKNSQKALQKAAARLAELESGRGAKLASIGQATLYEFWVTVPGYSGPVRGASARVIQHGDVQYVSKVSSKSHSGIPGGLVGGAVLAPLGLAPLGAIGGVLATRKTKVKTDVKKVDTRQFELEVTGPGFTWSATYAPAFAGLLEGFKNKANARGSSTDDVKALALSQTERVRAIQSSSANAGAARQTAAAAMEEARAARTSAWNEYATARLPIADDLRTRWAKSGTSWRVIAALVGPGMLAVWVLLLVVGLTTGNSGVVSVATTIAALHLLTVAVLALLFFYRVRLVKSA